MRFSSNGYCRSSLRAHDYDSIAVQTIFNPFMGSQLYQQNIQKLDAAVDTLLADTGFDQIELVGHSFGTGVSTDYVSDPTRASKVAQGSQVSRAFQRYQEYDSEDTHSIFAREP